MKTENVNIKPALGTVVISLALSLLLFTLSAEAADTSTPYTKETHIAKQQIDSKDNLKALTHKLIVKEAVDAFAATETVLKALKNNQPKQALAALEVVSGNLHLLLARDPALGLIPIDIQVQILEGVTDLKTIKALEDELDDLIDDGHYQAARPIVDSLVDELRVTTVYLPLATYPAAIDKIAPLIDAGKTDEAKKQLIDILDTYISDQEITPLAILRAEGNLTEAFQIEHLEGLSKQESKNKIEKLIKEAEQHIRVAEALGYGMKYDYQPLYDSINKLKSAVRKAKTRSEWAAIKKSLSAFKNKIIHPRD
jgi:hypothetical protein